MLDSYMYMMQDNILKILNFILIKKINEQIMLSKTNVK